MLITDASFIIAYFDMNDSQHTRAMLDMARIQEEGETFLVNNLVIQEVMTLHNTRYKRKTFFHHFCTAIVDGKSINMFFKMQEEKEFKTVNKMILQDKGNHLSFSDLSLIIDTQSMKSGRLLTYDKDLSKFAKKIKIPVFESTEYRIKS